MHRRLWLAGSLALLILASNLPAQPAGKVLSHPALRPLPEVAKRPLAKGPGFFLDPIKGKDSAAGTEKAPWRTFKRAFTQLSAGDTLNLRGGVYREPAY